MTTAFAIGLCLLVSFLYSGIEAGLLTLSRVRLQGRLRAGDPAAARLHRLLSHPERLLATVLLVTNFADVAALVLVTDALVRRFGAPDGYLLAFVVLLPVYLIGVQLIPKSLFRRFPYRALAALAGLLEITGKLLTPVLHLGAALAQVLTRRSGEVSAAATPRRVNVFVAREELKNFAAEGERTGALSRAERGMIHTVVDFRAVRARDVMVPLPAPVIVQAGLRVADVLRHAASQRLECVPVLRPAKQQQPPAPTSSTPPPAQPPLPQGNIVALLDTFTLLLDRDPSRELTAAGYLRRPPVIVSSDAPAYQLIRRLRTVRSNFAAVVDDGRPVGIVRARDLVERLVRGAEA
jgi:CBS domain containing-hemolysin-like protein